MNSSCGDVGVRKEHLALSQQLGLMVFHIAVWFCLLHCADVGSAY